MQSREGSGIGNLSITSSNSTITKITITTTEDVTATAGNLTPYVQSEVSLIRGGTVLAFASGASTKQSQRYQGGVRSGILLPSSSATSVQNFYKITSGKQRMKEAAACTGLDVAGVPTLPAKADVKPIDYVSVSSYKDLNIEVIDGEILGEE